MSIPLDYMLGMTHEEPNHWVWCGEHSEANVVELHKEALRLRKELEEKEELADKRMLEAQDWEDEYHALKRRYEELDNSALEKHELLMDTAAKYQAVSKELERLRSALETSLYHLKKEYYMSAEDCIEEALAVGQEGEGNQ